MIKNIFLVLLGGGIGSVARYLLSYFLTKNNTTQFPWATFIANGLGCLLIGLLFGYINPFDGRVITSVGNSKFAIINLYFIYI